MTDLSFEKETIARMPAAYRGEDTILTLDVGDVDGDGRLDVVTCQRTGLLAWFRNTGDGWDRYEIDEVEGVERGGQLHDVTGTGTLDIVCASDYQNSVVHWWENPGDLDGEWRHRVVVDTGNDKFHDALFADLTGDGSPSLVLTNQGGPDGTDVYRIPLPDDPTVSPWPDRERIATGLTVYNPGRDGDIPEEGLAVGDVDGDGSPELVVGGRWFEYDDGDWVEHRYTDEYVAPQIAVADVDGDGTNELVLAEADALVFNNDEGGKVGWFDPGEDPETRWTEHRIDDGRYDPHTLQVADLTDTDYPDVLVGEVGRREGDGYRARLPQILVYENHGDGSFSTHLVDQGTGIHDGQLVDLDGSGTLDLVGKPVGGPEVHEIQRYRQVTPDR